MSLTPHWLEPDVICCEWPVHIDLPALDESIATHDELLQQRRGAPYYSIQVASEGLPKLDATQRARMGDWMRQEQTGNHRNLRALAFVTSSAVARGTITAVGWISGQSCPWKTFSDRGEALAWINAERAAQP